MLTLEQNIRAVIETCFSESREDLQEIATQRIIELIESNASNTLGTHWIPCDERLPETDGRYLTIRKLRSCEIIGINTYSTNLNSIDSYIFRECKSGFYSYDSEYGYYPETNIIAWLPLPEVYKEK